MSGHGRHAVWTLFVTVIVACDFGHRCALATQPTPSQDDSHLWDVQFVGPQTGWAVGDRGAVWCTQDGGDTWEFVECPTDCTLRSVCFLTDKVGWIAGGGFAPFVQTGEGVLLHTSDGGKTWTQLAAGRLPPLCYVKFFGLQNGIAVGIASADFPAGVAITGDGGKTWESIEGDGRTGWRAAEFINLSTGVVSGLRGQVALVGGRRLLEPRVSDFGLRGFHGIALLPNQSGWMVGDGGFVLKTGNGGIVWEMPPSPLPAEVDEVFDFRTVACRGQHVWIAGQPGSIVWHSHDGGKSWNSALTGQSLPIQRLDFATDSDGCAVGELGTILQTRDGGATWRTVRGAGRRAALMQISASLPHVTFRPLVKYSAEQGYRSVVAVLCRQDVGPDGHRNANLDWQLHQAGVSAGASATDVGWQLPLGDIPGLAQDTEATIAAWMRQTEGRLPDVLLGKLVCALRTWRPNVVLVDRSNDRDAAADLAYQAIAAAVQQAADPTRFLEHNEVAGLRPWQVSKVYSRLPTGDTGHVHVDPYEVLPHVGCTVQMAAAPSYSIVGQPVPIDAVREAYRLIDGLTANDQPPVTGGDFWAGIALMPGSDGRRDLPSLSDDQTERQLRLAQRQRNLHAYADRFLSDSRHAAQLIGQLKEVVADMPDDQAAVQLVQLADRYRKRSQWDLVEQTLVELVYRFPGQPAAWPAMEWLFHYWSSAEVGWQRSRQMVAQTGQRRADYDTVARQVQDSIRRMTAKSFEEAMEPSDVVTASAVMEEQQMDRAAPLRTVSHQRWQRQALSVSQLIRRECVPLARSPHVQFALAALHRSRGENGLSDRVYYEFTSPGRSDPWKTAADGEVWLLRRNGFPPTPYALCRNTNQRPVLDGVPSEECWQKADQLSLRWSSPETVAPASVPVAYLSHDAEQLYFAATLPRVPGTPNDRPNSEKRQHDADLSRFDRISLYLDLDRDYSTYYALHIDQRGCVAESCWQNAAWNPKCFIAVDADDASWSVEAAIPFSELAPHAPQRRSAWSVGIVRTIPTVGIQSWTPSAGLEPRPESFGLVEFD